MFPRDTADASIVKRWSFSCLLFLPICTPYAREMTTGSRPWVTAARRTVTVAAAPGRPADRSARDAFVTPATAAGLPPLPVSTAPVGGIPRIPDQRVWADCAVGEGVPVSCLAALLSANIELMPPPPVPSAVCRLPSAVFIIRQSPRLGNKAAAKVA
jgi:hypothetical protein